MLCCAAAGANVNLADPNTGNAAQMAAAVGHIEVVEKLVEAGCAWPHGKKAHSGLAAPVDVVQLLSQKTGIPVSLLRLLVAGWDCKPGDEGWIVILCCSAYMQVCSAALPLWPSVNFMQYQC